jgi:hypothetical protein
MDRLKEWIKKIFFSPMAIDIYKRAAKTFLQAFMASIIFYLNSDPVDMSMWKPAIIAAISAGLSAVMNTFYNAIKQDDYY